MTSPAEIAAKLTPEAQQACITGECLHNVLVSDELAPLWYSVSKLGGGQFRINLTDLGLAVRAHLEKNDDRS